VVLHATRDGPIVVKGTVTLQLPNGQEQKRSGAFQLCRCGQTRNPPFCDGSHIRVGFRSPA
jgi:CDGSH-type Zn-finger protein